MKLKLIGITFLLLSLSSCAKLDPSSLPEFYTVDLECGAAETKSIHQLYWSVGDSIETISLDATGRVLCSFVAPVKVKGSYASTATTKVTFATKGARVVCTCPPHVFNAAKGEVLDTNKVHVKRTGLLSDEVVVKTNIPVKSLLNNRQLRTVHFKIGVPFLQITPLNAWNNQEVRVAWEYENSDGPGFSEHYYKLPLSSDYIYVALESSDQDICNVNVSYFDEYFRRRYWWDWEPSFHSWRGTVESDGTPVIMELNIRNLTKRNL